METLTADLNAIRQTLHEAAATLAAKGEPDAGAAWVRRALRCMSMTTRVAIEDVAELEVVAALVAWAKRPECPDPNLVNQAATRLARRVSK